MRFSFLKSTTNHKTYGQATDCAEHRYPLGPRHLETIRHNQAMFPLCQIVEIGMRFHFDRQLRSRFGPQWQSNQDFHRLLKPRHARTLNHRMGKVENFQRSNDTIKFVQALPQSFMLHLLEKRFDRDLWCSDVRCIMPDIPRRLSFREVERTFNKTIIYRNQCIHFYPGLSEPDCRNLMALESVARWVDPTATQSIIDRMERTIANDNA